MKEIQHLDSVLFSTAHETKSLYSRVQHVCPYFHRRRETASLYGIGTDIDKFDYTAYFFSCFRTPERQCGCQESFQWSVRSPLMDNSCRDT